MIAKPLSSENIAQAVELILTDFQPNEPLTKTFASNFPNLQLSQSDRRELWAHWITDSIEKQTIIGVFDKGQSQNLVGLSICKDINYDLPEIQQEFSSSLTEEKCFVELEQLFFKGLNEPLRNELKNWGTAFDIMIIVVAKEYQGKGISKILIAESEKLGRLQGFKYSYCQASNFKTSRSLKANNYDKLLEIDLREVIVEGVKPFFNINEEDRFPSSWIKKIN